MGRRPHVGEDKFSIFMDSVPDNLQNDGYWRVKKEHVNPSSGGVVQSILGYIQFNSGETYDELRVRIMEIAEKRGPGTYWAIACDDRKKEIKGIGMPKFEFTDREVEDMASDGSSNASTLRDTIKNVKGVHKDMIEMEKLSLEKEMLEDLLGRNKGKDEEVVRESAGIGGGNGMNDMLMYKMFFNDNEKKQAAPQVDTSQNQQMLATVFDAKLQGAIAEMKSIITQNQNQQPPPKTDDKVERLLEKLIDKQHDNQGSSKTDQLIEKLITGQQADKHDNAFQSMMALTVKENADREKVRQEEERTRRDKEDRDQRQRETERKEERVRWEQQVRYDRDKFDKELAEQKRRFDEETKIRRDEIKSDEDKNRRYSMEQQKFQLHLLEIFKSNKDNSLDMTAKIVETVTGAGLATMETAQKAATTIIDIAKKAEPMSREPDGLAGTIKDIASIAGPLLAAPQGVGGDTLQKLKMLQGMGGLEGLLGGSGGSGGNIPEVRPRPVRRKPSVIKRVNGNVSPEEKPVPVETKPKEGFDMIVQFLKAYPMLKDALIGNLQGNLGVDLFIPIITGFDQPVLEGILANLPHTMVMAEIKKACNNEEEKKLIDANEKWFVEFKKKMVEELIGSDEEEEVAEEAIITPAPEPAPQTTPTEK